MIRIQEEPTTYSMVHPSREAITFRPIWAGLIFGVHGCCLNLYERSSERQRHSELPGLSPVSPEVLFALLGLVIQTLFGSQASA